MHDLAPLTALGAQAPRIDEIKGARLSERGDVALASAAARLGQETACSAALADLIGTACPEPGTFAEGALTAFWMGPDMVMIEGPFDTHEELAAQVKTAVGNAGSVTEQTDAWVRFDLAAPDPAAILELLCAADTRRMETGAATRTSIHHLGCFLLRRAPDLISIYGPRASAGSLHHAVTTAMTAAL